MVQQCQTCRWWNVSQSWQLSRECRRHAPTVMLRLELPNEYRGDDQPRGVWPKTQGADACGDWTSKEIAE